jgi:hypothetical protein
MVLGQGCFFLAPQIFKSPYFSEYTNDATLKTNFRFIDPPPPQKKNKKKKQKQIKIKSHVGAVSPQKRLILQLLTQSGV